MTILMKMNSKKGIVTWWLLSKKYDDWDSSALLVYFDRKETWSNAWRNVSRVCGGDVGG